MHTAYKAWGGHGAKKAASATDLGTLLMRPSTNQTNLLDTFYHGTGNRNPNGSLGLAAGISAMQHQNKLLLLFSPFPKLENAPHIKPPENVKSIQTTIGLFNFATNPSWEIYVDAKRIVEFSAREKQAAHQHPRRRVVCGHHSAASDRHGRDAEVILTNQTGPLVELQGSGKANPR